MRLNHVDLQVSDIPVAARFFETFFGLRKVYQREGQIAILEDETGFCFGLSNLHNSPAPVYPVDFHVGFILENRNQVRTVYQRGARRWNCHQVRSARGRPKFRVSMRRTGQYSG